MTRRSEITILAVDDHPLIRDGLAAVIGREADMRVVAEAGDGEQALEQYRAHQPSIVLMDLRMPVMDGAEEIQAIRGESPVARIIALSAPRWWRPASRGTSGSGSGPAASARRSPSGALPPGPRCSWWCRGRQPIVVASPVASLPR